ncbi:hypothetical protein EVAR_40642_1 [Eumeta japonica]|uniref:Uncharacterized protein n=1 Tax=Eumeta variegata TaxID=151549 RepID=A0A4C1X6V2_EUMVA|nr:hypothetical protein EVAR_40642_1 [Eumeta japonica]
MQTSRNAAELQTTTDLDTCDNRGETNTRRSEGHECTVRVAAACPTPREWSDRHLMNRQPSLIDPCAPTAVVAAAAAAAKAPGPAALSVPAATLYDRRFRCSTEMTLPRTWRRAQEVRSLPIGTSPLGPTAAVRERTSSFYPHASTVAFDFRNGLRGSRNATNEDTQPETRAPLPRRGETDEGRPRRAPSPLGPAREQPLTISLTLGDVSVV